MPGKLIFQPCIYHILSLLLLDPVIYVPVGEADLSVSGENFTHPTCDVFQDCNVMERVAISEAHLHFKPFHLSTERPNFNQYLCGRFYMLYMVCSQRVENACIYLYSSKKVQKYTKQQQQNSHTGRVPNTAALFPSWIATAALCIRK